MKPVDQTRFGSVDGDCLMACVASILERPLEDLPILKQHSDGRHWWDDFEKVLIPFGVYPVYIPKCIPKGYAIGSGVSPRELRHAVVTWDGALVHDPHPSRAGVIGIEHYYVLYPILGVSEGK